MRGFHGEPAVTHQSFDLGVATAEHAVGVGRVERVARSEEVVHELLRQVTVVVATRGFGEAESADLAGWMCDVIANMDDDSVIESVREKVLAICSKYPVYQ